MGVTLVLGAVVLLLVSLAGVAAAFESPRGQRRGFIAPVILCVTVTVLLGQQGVARLIRDREHKIERCLARGGIPDRYRGGVDCHIPRQENPYD